MNPWLDPAIPAQMREKADADLQRTDVPIHFRALADAVAETQCPGSILEVGAGVGHNREVLDRAGIPYASYTGCDINPAAIALAKERYPESTWFASDQVHWANGQFDIVVDGSCVLHIPDWRAHLKSLCATSRRWVILHRIPAEDRADLARFHSHGYGYQFDAWLFPVAEVEAEMQKHGFEFVSQSNADGHSVTMLFARPRHWVTYADDAYLSRLKTLYASMVEHCGPFRLHVLAWDAKVAHWIENTTSVSGDTSEVWLLLNPELAIDKLPGPPRTKIEHYWTCGPQWIADVMQDTGEPVTYVDSDVCFLSSPEPVFAEIGGAPAGVVPHGFARAAQGLPGPKAETHEVFGKYNVGIVHVGEKRIAKGWAEDCREWCYDRLQRESNRIVGEGKGPVLYGDQKYLDYWTSEGAHVVTHPGACLGPWAVHTRALDLRDGVVHFGGRPIVSYHYSALRELPDGHSVATRPEYRLTKRQEEIIYGPIWKALKENR